MKSAPFRLPAALLLGSLASLPTWAESPLQTYAFSTTVLLPTLADTVLSPRILAGDPAGTFPGPDTSADRIDPNVPASLFAGVVSLFIDAPGPGGFLCTGTAISPTAVLTAGHCVDLDNNGTADVPGSAITVVFNNTAVAANRTGLAVYTHPDYTGFNSPTVNDDLAVVQLQQSAPAGVPFYPLLPAGAVDITGEIFKGSYTGYGTTGDGVSGFAANSSSFTTKRTGANLVEAYDLDDEGSGAPELWYADFEETIADVLFSTPTFDVYDGNPAHDAIGILTGLPFPLTLGNTVESSTGPGDSGGPLFVEDDLGNLFLAGTTTFGADVFSDNPGGFGSLHGGIWLEDYHAWIQYAATVPEPSTYAAGAILGLLGLWQWHRARR